jgi:hypothetical protein
VPTSDLKSKFHYTLGRYSKNSDVTGLPDIQSWRKVLLYNDDRASSRSSVESSCNACRVATAARTEISKEKLLAFGFLKLSSSSMQLFLKSFKVVLLS